MTLAVFHDFPGPENGLTKFHDFPGRVVTTHPGSFTTYYGTVLIQTYFTTFYQLSYCLARLLIVALIIFD